MPYLIDNYRPAGTNVSSSEFIKKTAGGLNITKTHGLGSGIYGLKHGTKTPRAGVETLTTHEIMNPVILDTNAKSALFIEFTQFFNELIEKYINGSLKGAAVMASIDSNKDLLDRAFSELFPDLEGTPKANLNRAIIAFSTAYKGAVVGDLLWQPINYLLKPKYGGIFNSSEDGNTLDRGSVLFVAVQPRHQKQAFNHEGAFIPFGRKLVLMAGGRRKSRRSKSRKLAFGTKRANRKYIAK